MLLLSDHRFRHSNNNSHIYKPLYHKARKQKDREKERLKERKEEEEKRKSTEENLLRNMFHILFHQAGFIAKGLKLQIKWSDPAFTTLQWQLLKEQIRIITDDGQRPFDHAIVKTKPGRLWTNTTIFTLF